MWANRTDEELLRALPREPGAFSAFYRRHVDDVLGFLARRCRDPEQAADLTAEVFATVLPKARRYRPERAAPAGRARRAADRRGRGLHRGAGFGCGGADGRPARRAALRRARTRARG